jgi:hypothetical protein
MQCSCGEDTDGLFRLQFERSRQRGERKKEFASIQRPAFVASQQRLSFSDQYVPPVMR